LVNFFKACIEILIFTLSGLCRRRDNRIIFGAWAAEKYADNSRYMIEFLNENTTKYELIWIGKKGVEKELPRNIRFITKNSLHAIYYCLTAKYIFITHSYYDISSFNLFKGANIIQLWHGIGVKKLVITPNNNNNKLFKIREKIRSIIRCYDYFICSSEMNRQRNLIAFKSYGINKDNIINSGQPRNDCIINSKSMMNSKCEFKEKISKKIDIDITDRKLILYLPTYRKYTESFFSFTEIKGQEKKEITSILSKHNAVLIEKTHQLTKKNYDDAHVRSEKIYNLSSYDNLNTQDLLLASDILITDYSSCYLDYLLLDKPIIHFAYDYESYQKLDQGLYYDLNDIAAGDIVENFNGLLQSLNKNLENNEHNKGIRNHVKKIMMEYENGNSCEIIARKLKIID
jgi:CDP-glycerol glycerophosphotransferase